MGQAPSATQPGQPNSPSPDGNGVSATGAQPGENSSPTDLANLVLSLDLSGTDFGGNNFVKHVRDGDLNSPKYNSLAALSLANCQLSHVEWLASPIWATSLADLDLSRNLITSLDGQNELLFFLKHLTRLNLSYNYITSMPPLFFNLLDLQTLNLSNNNLDTVCAELKYLERLTDLDLSCNQLRSIPEQLGLIPHLQKLKLNQNKLKLLPDTLGNLTELAQLSLSDNFLSKLPNSVGSLTALRKLYLDNNELVEIPMDAFGKLTALRELFVNQNQLYTLPSIFHKLSNLSLIDISDNVFPQDSPLGVAASKAGLEPEQLVQTLTAHEIYVESMRSSIKRGARQERMQKKAKTGRDTLRLLPSGNSPASVASVFSSENQPPAAPKKRKGPSRNKLYRVCAISGSEYVVVDRLPVTFDELSTQWGAFVLDIPSPPPRDESTAWVPPVIIIWLSDKCDPRETAKASFLARSINLDVYADAAVIATLDHKALSNWIGSFPNAESNFGVSPLAMFAMQFKLGVEKDFRAAEKSLRAKSVGETQEQFQRRVIDHRVEHTRLWKFALNDDEVQQTDIRTSNSANAAGSVSISIVGGDGVPLSKTVLESSAVYVVDCGGAAGDGAPSVWVWCGHFADPQSRNWALLKAEQLMNAGSGENEDDVELSWSLDGAEMWDFKELFWDWDSFEWDPQYRETLRKQMVEEEEQRRLLETELVSSRKPQPEAEPQKPTEEHYTEQMVALQQQEKASAPTSAIEESPAAPAPVVAPAVVVPPIEPVASPAESAEAPITKPSGSMRKARPKRSEPEISTKAPDVSPPATQAAPAKAPLVPEMPVAPAAPSLLERLTQLIEVPHPTPRMPPHLPQKIGFFDLAEKVQQRVLLGAEPQQKTRPTAAERRANFTRGLSAFNLVPAESRTASAESDSKIGESASSTQRLAAPRRAAAPAGRRAATANPVRQRAALAQKAEEDSKQQEGTKDEGASAAEAAQREARLRAAGGAAMGFGNAILGAAESKLQLQRDKAEGKVDVAALAASSEDAYAKKGQPRLMQIKGRRKLIVRLVEVTYLSLNGGDVFILDNGKGVLYQWNSKGANRIEKGKGMDICKNIKDKELMGNGKVVVLEQGGNDTTDAASQFWSILGAPNSKPEISTSDSAGDDENIDEMLKEFTNLFKIVASDALPAASPAAPSAGARRSRALSRQVSVAVEVHPELVARYPLKKDMLSQENCYILDCGSELYVWCGGKSSLPVRKQTMKLVEDLRAARISDQDIWVAPIARELPGGESVLFREKFSDWGYGPPIQMQQIVVGKNVAKVAAGDKIDVVALFNKKAERQEVLVDDGKGKKKIWRIVDFKKVAVDPSDSGQFFAADSYIILYSYPVRNKEAHMIYYWQGSSSSINEKGTSALLTIELGDEVDQGNTKQVHAVMNQEPQHFLLLFKDSYVIHSGKSDSGVPDGPSLYQVQGASEAYCKCIQIDATPNGFVSNGCFIVVSSKEKSRNIFIWQGKHARPYEITYAEAAEKIIRRRFGIDSSPKIVVEGKENTDFWKALGTSKPSSKSKFPVVSVDRLHTTRLFHSSESTGQHKVWEIPPPFAQEELTRNEGFILDCFDRIFVWHWKASASDLKKAMEVAVEYAEKAPDDRARSCPIHLVEAGKEPLVFTSHFHAWRPIPSEVDPELPDVRSELAKFSQKYSYDDLINKRYPPGIDTTKLENYLADEEFETVFGVSRDDFMKLPGWKQQKEKREKGMF